MPKRMTIPLLRLDYTDEEIAEIQNEVAAVLKSGYLTMHDKVREFEGAFARWCGCEYALGTNSGTSSLEIPMRALGVEDKTVICPSNTYMASPISIVHAKGRVIFAECRRDDFQLDPDDLLRKIQPDTVGVMAVHIGGIISPHWEKIEKICSDHSLWLIEDAAHAHGATFKGRMAGSLGDAGSFSFYPTKVMVTAEGGMMTTNRKDIYDKGVILREHGKRDHDFNVHTEFGYNWRFSELHAILGIQQMRKADKILAERRRLARKYDTLFDKVNGVERIVVPENVQSAYYKYLLMIDPKIDRNELKRRLIVEYGVSLTGEVYSDPCHSQPVFKSNPKNCVNDPKDEFSETEYVCRNHICPPLYPGLTDEEVEYVADSLNRVLETF